MGRKRKYKKRTTKRKYERRNKKTISSDILGGMLVIFSILLVVFLTFDNMGNFASVVSSMLTGLFGISIFLLPIMGIYIGIHVIVSNKKISIGNEIFKGILVSALAAALCFTFTAKSFTLFDNPFKFTVDVFNEASVFDNYYGVLGGIIGNIFVVVFDVILSKILLIFITLISLLYVFGISLKRFIVTIINAVTYTTGGIANVLFTVFRKDDVKINRRRNKKTKVGTNNEIEIKGLENNKVDKNLKADDTDQVEFDFSKLGGRTKEQIEAEGKRDDFFKKQTVEKEDKNVKEILTLDHTKHIEEENYVFPPINILGLNKNKDKNLNKKAIHATAVKLQKTLASFGVEAKVSDITKGPSVTRYELTPSIGVKVSKIVNLSDDIALNLAAKSIRIEAPIPGKAAVGIEVPNETCEAVFLREIIEDKKFKKHDSSVAFALGKDASGTAIVGDIGKMPHMLIAGATGSGKSVCINSIIVSLIYKSKPSEVKLIMIDPKMVELSGYNGIPHLLIPVVTDPKKAAGTLNWAVQEMVNRYNLFAEKGVKDIKGYNKLIESEEGVKLPKIVIIIDELSDLMMVAPNDVEDAICRLAQMARAAGMHLIIATQRPSVDVITGIIKANIPSRIAFTVSSSVDSRTILDSSGAEKLLGKGDMLYFPVGANKPHRVQGTWVSEKEIEKVVNSIKIDEKYNDEIIQSIEKVSDNVGKKKSSLNSEDVENLPEEDALLNEAIDLVMDMGQASASMLQRKFRIGYSRAGRIVDQMEDRGLISGRAGSKPRKLLISKQEWQEIKFSMQQKEKEEKGEGNGN